MFRNLIVSALMLFTALAWAECDPDEEECPPTAAEIEAAIKAKIPFEFIKVRQVTSLKKTEIISYIAVYIAENYVSPKTVIQLNDPTNGRIVFQVRIWDESAGIFTNIKGIDATLSIDAKDGRFRLKATAVDGIRSANGVFTASINSEHGPDIKPVAYKLLGQLLNKLEVYLNKAKKDADW